MSEKYTEGFIPSAPLFRDPVYDGAADPTLIYNRKKEEWWMFYTNRRAWGPNIKASFMHGTDIGIAVLVKGKTEWVYRGTAAGLELEEGRNTFWAPEIIEAEDGYHMYCSYVRGIPLDWNHERQIIHYTSSDLWNWKYQGPIALSSDRVIDACVFHMPSGEWKMWYKDERDDCHTWAAKSQDLYHWEVLGPEITDCPHEGPNVFFYKGYYWMITDCWNGFGVYRSNDGTKWTRKKNILDVPGKRQDDGSRGGHGDVVVCGEHAYVFYFIHPGMTQETWENGHISWTYEQRRSSVQVAELTFDGDGLCCDRDREFYLKLVADLS